VKIAFFLVTRNVYAHVCHNIRKKGRDAAGKETIKIKEKTKRYSDNIKGTLKESRTGTKKVGKGGKEI
jgi:hypothetical protein